MMEESDVSFSSSLVVGQAGPKGKRGRPGPERLNVVMKRLGDQIELKE
jgi:hypothetical protein